MVGALPGCGQAPAPFPFTLPGPGYARPSEAPLVNRPESPFSRAARAPRRAGILPHFVAIAALCLASPAVAQAPADVSTAKRWFKEAEDAEKLGDYRLALSRFEQALSVKATPQLHLRIGACQEKLGRIIEAQESYERALEKANAQALEPVAKVAEEQIQALRPRIPTVSIVPAKAYPGLEVAIDGVPVAPAALGAKVPINPGAHTLTAEAKGYARREQRFSAVERDAQALEINLLPVDLVHPPPSPSPSSSSSSSSSSPPPPPRSSRVPAIVLLGGGVAAVGGGAALVVVSLLKDKEIDGFCLGAARLKCPSSREGEINASVSTINAMRFSGISLGGVGLVGAALGTYLLVSRSTAPARAQGRALQVAPAVGPRSLGIVAQGSF